MRDTVAKSEMEQELALAIAELAQIDRELKDQDKRVADAITERDRLTRARRQNEHHITILTELKVIALGLPLGVVSLRDKIIRKTKQSKREDITVAKRRSLRSEVTFFVSHLQKSCPHIFLLSYDGYEGDRMYEYENARYGQRKCVICELTESSKSIKIESYQVLSDKDGRLVKRDLRESEGNWGKGERQAPWQPLNYFIEAFRRSAGENNIRWPVIENGEITEKSDLFLK